MNEATRSDRGSRTNSTHSRVGSPPLVMMESDQQYNIEDEAWADTMDPKTGSVFYIDPVSNPEPLPEPTPKPPSSPLLVHHERTSSAGEPSRSSHDKSPRWKFRKKLISVGNARGHDDTDLNSSSEPDLRGSPKILRGRNKYVNPFAALYNGSSTSLEPRIIPNTPEGSTLSVHINLQHSREWKSCCLRNLGIVPVRPKINGSTLSLKGARYSGHESVVIRDVLPDSVATNKLLPGDRLVAVNGNEVYHSNIDVVLARVGLVSPELVLQVSRGSGSGQAGATADGNDSELVKLLSKKGSHCSPRPIHRLPHLLMYLTLNTAEDDDENKDIVYMYPNTLDSAIMNKLYHLRAICLTLTDVMTSSIGSGDTSCTCISIDGQLMSLVSIQYDKEVMMLAVPARCCSTYELKLVASQVEQVLCLLYQFPQSAFSSTANKQHLNYLFGLFFEQFFTVKKSSSLLPFHFSSVMSLPANLKVKVSCALTSLDSADFSSRAVLMHTPASYSSLGSCVFYKGCLLCSHLPFDDLKDLMLFSVMHSLLNITSKQRISQLVVWRKIYLRRLSKQKCSCFMLAVGLGHTIVYQLMELAASSNPDDHHINMPDAISIDKLRSLILELDAKGILEECESCHTSGAAPCLQSIDVALLSNLRTGTVKRSASLSVSDFEETGTSFPHSPTKSKGSIIGLGSKKKSLIASLSAGSEFSTLHAKLPYMLTSGLDNVLFHYVSLDWAKGVLIIPTHTLNAASHIHEAMLETFGRTCISIQEALQTHEYQLKGAGNHATFPDNEADEQCVIPHKPVLEQGVLVQCPVSTAALDKHSKHIPKLFYWIVGRRLPETGREFYVCFQDTIPQNAVELAFRLHFGSVD